MRSNFEKNYQEFFVKTHSVQENAVHFDFPRQFGPEEWSLVSVGVELLNRVENASVVAVLYKNLVSQLPSLRRSIEYK